MKKCRCVVKLLCRLDFPVSPIYNSGRRQLRVLLSGLNAALEPVWCSLSRNSSISGASSISPQAAASSAFAAVRGGLVAVTAVAVAISDGAVCCATRTECGGDLRCARGVPESSQLSVRRGDADLKVSHRLAGERVFVDCCAFWPCRGTCCGVLDERVSVWRWSWLGAREQFAEIVGMRDAFSQVARVSKSSQARQQPMVELWFSSASGQKRSRIVLMIEVWSNNVCETEPGSIHGERSPLVRARRSGRTSGGVVGRLRRRDVVEKAAVLVVEDDQ